MTYDDVEEMHKIQPALVAWFRSHDISTAIGSGTMVMLIGSLIGQAQNEDELKTAIKIACDAIEESAWNSYNKARLR